MLRAAQKIARRDDDPHNAFPAAYNITSAIGWSSACPPAIKSSQRRLFQEESAMGRIIVE
jgi:hypothetical protein